MVADETCYGPAACGRRNDIILHSEDAAVAAATITNRIASARARGVRFGTPVAVPL